MRCCPCTSVIYFPGLPQTAKRLMLLYVAPVVVLAFVDLLELCVSRLIKNYSTKFYGTVITSSTTHSHLSLVFHKTILWRARPLHRLMSHVVVTSSSECCTCVLSVAIPLSTVCCFVCYVKCVLSISNKRILFTSYEINKSYINNQH